MAKSFNKISDVLKYIEVNMVISFEQIGEEIKGVLRQHVQVLWYNRPFTPTHYTRTMELIDSITVTKAKKMSDGSYEIVIYFDTDKINPYSASDGEWSKHQSITDGEDVSEMIPLWIEYGQNSPIYSYEGVRPVGETVDWVKENSYLKERMRELLELKGFKCI